MTPDPFNFDPTYDIGPASMSVLPSLAGTDAGKAPDFTRAHQAEDIAFKDYEEQKAAAAKRQASADTIETGIEKTQASEEDLNAQRLKELHSEEEQTELMQANAPKDHLQYVMAQSPLLLLALAFSTGLTHTASATALSSLNGMVQGLKAGSDEQYSQASAAHDQAMKTLQEKWALRDKIYQGLKGAYGDSLQGQSRRWEIANAGIENHQAMAQKSFGVMTHLIEGEDKLKEQWATRKQAAGAISPTQLQSLAQDVAHYKLSWAGATTRMAPQAKAMLDEQIRQINPDWSALNFPVMQHAAMAWTGSGANQKLLNSFNTATGHLNQLRALGDEIMKGASNSQTSNSVINYFKREFNNPHLAGYEAIKGLVADEVVRLATGGQGALADRLAEVANFTASKDIPALHDVIHRYNGIMGERLASLELNYINDFMGQPPVPFDEKMTPPAHAAYQQFQLQQGNAGALNKSPTQPPGAPPTQLYFDAQGNQTKAPQAQ